MKLIRVNGSLDFKTFVKEIKSANTGLDCQDFLNFFEDDSIVLAFVGKSRKGSRIICQKQTSHSLLKSCRRFPIL